jgi:hypothetical protein
MRQIELDAGRGKTLGEFIKKYAPPSENDTELYISQMEKWTGYSKDTKLTDIPTTTLAKNIAKKESGATFKTGETDEEDEESELLSINKIDKFRRNYGWTPPYGFTEDQLLQYMKDNPNATPEELEQGAKQALRERNGGQQEQPQQTQEPQQTVNEDYIKKQISTERLKEIADKLGKSSWLTPKSWDINRAMPDIMAKVETAQDKGYTTEEIINYLKNDL